MLSRPSRGRPVTPERFARLRRVLDRRQPDLTVLLDNVHKTHNFSAILRSCDAVGVYEAHAVWPDPRLRPNHMTSGGAGKWVGVRTHARLDGAIAQLRERGFTIVAAHLGRCARDFRDIDYCRPTALVLGSELDGLSAAVIEAADAFIEIPMMGMVQSLNVSVAAATILFEASRQRSAAGLYDRRRLDERSYHNTLFAWAHPKIAEYCQRHRRDYPALDACGEICGKFP